MSRRRAQRSLVLWLQGGIGNQLFQLNGAHSLGTAANIPVVISRASFLRDRLRALGISPLLAPAERLTWTEELALGWPYARDGRVRDRLKPSGLTVLNADDPSISPAPGSLLLGFFQVPQHLRSSTRRTVDRLIRARDHTLPGALVDRIRGRTIAHVRRTDYVCSASAASRFGALGKQYYQSAFAELGASNREVIFFTDDVEFVRSEFRVPRHQIFGSTDTASDLEALLLMSTARNLVIANSTFSWWAAEIAGRNAGVCAPQTWFRDGDESSTLARQDWVKIPNG